MRINRKDFLRITGLAGLGLVAGCGGAGGIDDTTIPPDIPKPLEEYKDYKNLLGDIHVHSVVSDGDESPDFALRYARDVSRLDFCSLSDHAEPIAESNFVAMPYYRTLPAKYDEPGKFCVLFGFEWTSGEHGHRCVYSLDNQIPILPSRDPAYKYIEDFWDDLSGYDVIAIPHHPMIPSTHNWWEIENPGLERLVEFYSKWGLSTHPDNPRPVPYSVSAHSVFEAMRNGRRFGLIGSTDTHLTRPGSRLLECRDGVLEYPQPGLCGVWAESHTREAIYRALKNRRCYGMSGTRVNLQFTVNGAVMGTEISSSTSPSIAFKASSEQKITQVSIWKFMAGQNTVIKTWMPNALEAEGTHVDAAFSGDCSYTVQVDLANTDIALASPVWVAKTNPI